MKNRIIKIICALICIPMLWGCNKTVESMTPYDSAVDFRPEEGEIFMDVPKERYENYHFRVLSAKTGLVSSKVDSDSITGSTVSDSIYQRNLNVQSRLGIIITETRDTPENVYKTAVTSVLAHEDTYSAVWNYASYMGAMAANGYLVSSDFLLEADYEKPWWNTDAMSQTAIAEKSFLLFGDIHLSYYDAHSMVGVNMELLEKIDGAADPYELVKSGKWTFEEMHRLMKMAEADVDGDSERDEYDRYGMAADSEAALPLILSMGTTLSAKDEYDLPYITCYGDERFYDIYTAVAQKIFSDDHGVYNCDSHAESDYTPLTMFQQKKSLFVVTTVGDLDHLRNMESEFGVLPMPKYGREQSEYMSYISGSEACALGIPVTGTHFLRTGVILENMAAESYRAGGLREIYVDNVLNFRYVDNDKSRECLAIILDSGKFDLAEIYGWGGLSDTISDLAATGSEKYTSSIAAIKNKTESELIDFIELAMDF